jgi:hypothetical protein
MLDRTRDRAHGRIELRTLKVVSVRGFGFPHVAQVIQVTRKTLNLRAPVRRWRTVVVYAVTSLPHAQASPGRLADLIRGHWAIESGLHYVRDVTFAEDGSRVRTGTGPQIMACLRNLVIEALCRAGPVNLAAALRHHSRDPYRPWSPSGSSSDETRHYARTPEPWGTPALILDVELPTGGQVTTPYRPSTRASPMCSTARRPSGPTSARPGPRSSSSWVLGSSSRSRTPPPAPGSCS